MGLAGAIYIVSVGPLSGEETVVLLPPHRGADAGRAHGCVSLVMVLTHCDTARARLEGGCPVAEGARGCCGRPFHGQARENLTKLNRWRGKPGRIKSLRSEEHTSELQSLMRISYAVF